MPGQKTSIKIPKVKVNTVDAMGCFMLPGFIDTHVHIMTEGFGREETLYNPLSTLLLQCY